MLLDWGFLSTVTVIRKPKEQQNSDCQFHLETFPPSSLCTRHSLNERPFARNFRDENEKFAISFAKAIRR